MATQHGRWICLSTSHFHVSLTFFVCFCFPQARSFAFCRLHLAGVPIWPAVLLPLPSVFFAGVPIWPAAFPLLPSAFIAGVPNWPAASAVCNVQECQSGWQPPFLSVAVCIHCRSANLAGSHYFCSYWSTNFTVSWRVALCCHVPWLWRRPAFAVWLLYACSNLRLRFQFQIVLFRAHCDSGGCFLFRLLQSSFCMKGCWSFSEASPCAQLFRFFVLHTSLMPSHSK